MSSVPLQAHPLPKQGILFSMNQKVFAVNLTIIKEVIIPDSQLARLPMVSPFIQGLILSRNDIFPVVYLGNKDGINQTEESRLILLQDGTQKLALYADTLYNIYPFPSDSEAHSSDLPADLQDMSLFCFEAPIGIAHYLDFHHLYNQLISKASELDKA